MSNLGVDLLRSDTGHYMQWPLEQDLPPHRGAAAPADAAASPCATTSARGRTWIAALAPDARARSSAGARATAESGSNAAGATWVADDIRAGTGVAVAMVNWLFLLLMFCAFLLAATLPHADRTLTGGRSGGTTTTSVATSAR